VELSFRAVSGKSDKVDEVGSASGLLNVKGALLSQIVRLALHERRIDGMRFTTRANTDRKKLGMKVRELFRLVNNKSRLMLTGYQSKNSSQNCGQLPILRPSQRDEVGGKGCG
jgi:hypothetical protein